MARNSFRLTFIIVVFIGLSDENFRRARYVQRIGGGGTATQCKNK